jgi:hypothetical protein
MYNKTLLSWKIESICINGLLFLSTNIPGLAENDTAAGKMKNIIEKAKCFARKSVLWTSDQARTIFEEHTT